MRIKTYAQISIICLFCLLISYFYQAVTTIPTEGDSLVYHLPIAQSVLNGSILRPSFDLGFYPGNAEVILALFLKFHFPLNLFNLLAWVLLFFTSLKLGAIFGLKKDLAKIYSVSLCALPSILRWLPTQVIDIWLAVFFIFSLILLEKPKDQNFYFFKLGLALGLLIGVKYSGILIATAFLPFYFNRLYKLLNFQRFLLLFFPIVFFGFSWYLRNYLVTQNPFYPQTILFFKGLPQWHQFAIQQWTLFLKSPLKTVNSYVSEFLFWPITLPIIIYFVLRSTEFTRPALLGLLNFLIFLFLPASFKYNVMVSNLRYAYPAFILLILCLFLLAQKFKKDEEISIITLCGFMFLPPLAYHPKLLLLALILVFTARRLNLTKRIL